MKPIYLTEAAKEKAQKAKAYIESKYKKMGDEDRERQEAWGKLINQMNLLNLSEAEQEMIKQDIRHKEAEINRRM